MSHPSEQPGSTVSAGFEKWNRFAPTVGLLAVASFFVCVLSGISLAIPYDIHHPFDSLQVLQLTNRAGAFFRGLHYWSAQLFLILTLLHIWEHLLKGTEKELSRGIWMRLTISVPVVLFVMLSGFILKADSEGLLARRILGGLLGIFPQVGRVLEFAVLGPEADLQILYVHHIATATLFILLITIEHAQRLWPTWRSVIYATSVAVLLSFLALPKLHSGTSAIVKGPRYFLGMQEILHWLAYPLWAVLSMIAFLVVFYLIVVLPETWARIVKRLIGLSMIAYGLLTLFAWLFRGPNWQFVLPWQ